MSNFSYGVSVLDAWARSRSFCGFHWIALTNGQVFPDVNLLCELSRVKWYFGPEFEMLGISTDLREVRLFSNDDISEFWGRHGEFWRDVDGGVWVQYVFPDGFYSDFMDAFFEAFPYIREPECLEDVDWEYDAFFRAFPYARGCEDIENVEIPDEVFGFLVEFLDGYIERNGGR